MWNGNRESVEGALWGREALIPYSFRAHYLDRRHYPIRFARLPFVRLRGQADIDGFLSDVVAT